MSSTILRLDEVAYDEKIATIRDQDLQRLRSTAHDSSVSSVCCVDEELNKHLNPFVPDATIIGGLMSFYIYEPDLIEVMVRKALEDQREFRFPLHVGCGFLKIEGYDTIDKQRDVVCDCVELLQLIERDYGCCGLIVASIHFCGTATPYMS